MVNTMSMSFASAPMSPFHRPHQGELAKPAGAHARPPPHPPGAAPGHGPHNSKPVPTTNHVKADVGAAEGGSQKMATDAEPEDGELKDEEGELHLGDPSHQADDADRLSTHTSREEDEAGMPGRAADDLDSSGTQSQSQSQSQPLSLSQPLDSSGDSLRIADPLEDNDEPETQGSAAPVTPTRAEQPPQQQQPLPPPLSSPSPPQQPVARPFTPPPSSPPGAPSSAGVGSRIRVRVSAPGSRPGSQHASPEGAASKKKQVIVVLPNGKTFVKEEKSPGFVPEPQPSTQQPPPAPPRSLVVRIPTKAVAEKEVMGVKFHFLSEGGLQVTCDPSSSGSPSPSPPPHVPFDEDVVVPVPVPVPQLPQPQPSQSKRKREQSVTPVKPAAKIARLENDSAVHSGQSEVKVEEGGIKAEPEPTAGGKRKSPGTGAEVEEAAGTAEALRESQGHGARRAAEECVVEEGVAGLGLVLPEDEVESDIEVVSAGGEVPRESAAGKSGGREEKLEKAAEAVKEEKGKEKEEKEKKKENTEKQKEKEKADSVKAAPSAQPSRRRKGGVGASYSSSSESDSGSESASDSSSSDGEKAKARKQKKAASSAATTDEKTKRRPQATVRAPPERRSRSRSRSRSWSRRRGARRTDEPRGRRSRTRSRSRSWNARRSRSRSWSRRRRRERSESGGGGGAGGKRDRRQQRGRSRSRSPLAVDKDREKEKEREKSRSRSRSRTGKKEASTPQLAIPAKTAIEEKKDAHAAVTASGKGPTRGGAAATPRPPAATVHGGKQQVVGRAGSTAAKGAADKKATSSSNWRQLQQEATKLKRAGDVQCEKQKYRDAIDLYLHAAVTFMQSLRQMKLEDSINYTLGIVGFLESCAKLSMQKSENERASLILKCASVLLARRFYLRQDMLRKSQKELASIFPAPGVPTRSGSAASSKTPPTSHGASNGSPSTGSHKGRTLTPPVAASSPPDGSAPGGGGHATGGYPAGTHERVAGIASPPLLGF
eukprot:TRINITY_DN370_c0_g1_i2.p1 TRINITY_DN370_c0_g1~~TRINITY_DN370_c0_g1_i2.p1  ORF type:complete len:1105 (-),score=282.06 TRINITY_DN370_c0_g1_i2:241-3228(-)